MTEKKVKFKSNQSITLDPSYLDDAKDWEDFVNLWFVSKEVDQRNQWFKGDIANKVAITHGDGSLKRFSKEVEESHPTVENYRRVSRAFPESKRNWKLSWTHYFLASYTDSFKKGLQVFDTNNRDGWIEKAHDNNWTTTRMKEEIKKKKAFAGKKDSSVFDYYESFIQKTRHILLHVEKARLSDVERMKLIHMLLDTYNEFMVYLKDKK